MVFRFCRIISEVRLGAPSHACFGRQLFLLELVLSIHTLFPFLSCRSLTSHSGLVIVPGVASFGAHGGADMAWRSPNKCAIYEGIENL